MGAGSKRAVEEVRPGTGRVRALLARNQAGSTEASQPAPVRDPSSKGMHIEVCLHEDVEYRKSAGFERFEFVNEACADLSLAHIDLGVSLAGKSLKAPLMIGPMTGGTPRALEINWTLAAAAQRFGLAMGVGSQRVAIEHPELEPYFRVRDVAPDILLFANIGAAQLARGWGAPEAMRAVRMIGADALFVHINPLQEAIQGGDRDFRTFAARLAQLCRDLTVEGVPVFAREIGFGLSTAAARRLVECGVAGLDCAGAGGTSWAKVEAFCARTPERRALGQRFGEWGIPTSESIRMVREAATTAPLVASGGLRSGMDLAKALALGADVGAMARPMLQAAAEGAPALESFIGAVLEDLRVCMFASGAARVADLAGRLVPAITNG
jgi:isopentenyl-diphosphate delta-isomerase